MEYQLLLTKYEKEDELTTSYSQSVDYMEDMLTGDLLDMKESGLTYSIEDCKKIFARIMDNRDY